MIRLPDVNILLNSVNSGGAHHEPCREWLDAMSARAEPLGWAWHVMVGFVRLATTKSVFGKPLTGAEAMDHVDRWLALPHSRILVPGSGHPARMRRVIAEANAVGNLVPDAHLAALAIEHDAEICSCDNDFSRFPGLRWFNPATGSRTGS